jgi:uncharacterized membrane protein YoaK (UPF0700 family)
VPHPNVAPFATLGWDSPEVATLGFGLVTTVEDSIEEVFVSEELHHARSLALSVALGAAMGAAIGAATGHMGIWVAAGIAAYIAISLVGVWSRPND